MEKVVAKKRVTRLVLAITIAILFFLSLKSCRNENQGKETEITKNQYIITGNLNINYGNILDREKIKVIVNGKEISASIDDHEVNYDKLGKYKVTVIYKDESGKEQKIKKEIKIVDNESPTILLKGSNEFKIEANSEYQELGYEISDNYDKKEDIQVSVTGVVNTSLPGKYTLTYIAIDSSGNKSETKRTVVVEEKKKVSLGVTSLQLKGTSTVYVDYPNKYIELGATAIDTVDKDISEKIKISGNVDTNKIGTYTLTYEIINSSNVVTKTTRTVIIRDNAKPTIKLIGDSDVTIEINSIYTEQGVIISDNYDTNLKYTVHGVVDTNKVGVYNLTYQVKDSSSNIASIIRTIRVVKTKHLVIFHSGGSNIESQIIPKNGFAQTPTAPTRSGYTFSHWYKEGTDESIPFNFDTTKIEEDTVLLAKWSQQIVSYTVNIWMEPANFYGTPTPGNMNDYDFVTSVNLTGRAGDKANLNIDNLPSNLTSLFTNTTSILRFATPQYIENKELLGNGNTIINLYAKRKEYTYVFDLGTSASRTMTLGGTTYKGNSTAKYSINVKYEMDISGIFPLQGLDFVTFSTGFASWGRPSTLTWKDTAGLASIRKIVDQGMISENGQTSTYTFTANWTASGTSYTFRYFIELLPNQEIGSSPIITYNGKDYVLMDEYNQNYQGNLNAKMLDGLTVVNTNYSSCVYNSYTNTYTLGSATGAHRCFFYNRNNYTLSFNMKAPNGTTVAPIVSQSIPFGDSLANYKPSSNPSLQGGNYTFAGWYTDSTYSKIFNFDLMSMPAGNITIFAKWESTDNKITFLDSKDGNVVGTQGVANGSYAIDNSIQYLNLDSNDFVSGKGTFVGWYFDMSGHPFKWTFETSVNSNYTLYAVWK